MNGKITLILLVVFLVFQNALATDYELCEWNCIELAMFDRYGLPPSDQSSQLINAFYDRHMAPIIEAFGLPVNKQAFLFDSTSLSGSLFGHDSIAVRFHYDKGYTRKLEFMTMTNTPKSGEKVDLEHGSDYVNTDTIIMTTPPNKETSIIRFRPSREYENDMDWFVNGAEADSPPIETVSQGVIDSITQRWANRYPYSSYAQCIAGSACVPECTIEECAEEACPMSAESLLQEYQSGTIKPFAAETETNVQMPSGKYTAWNGYTAYIIPAPAYYGKKGKAYLGVQLLQRKLSAKDLWCHLSICQSVSVEPQEVTVDGKKFFEIDLSKYFDNVMSGCSERNLQEKVEHANFSCMVTEGSYLYVDKVFFPERQEAIRADWVIPTTIRDSEKIPVRLGQPPEIDFEWKITDASAEGYTVAFNALTNKPSEIDRFQWLFGDGARGTGKTVEHFYNTGGKEAEYMVELKAYGKNMLYNHKIRELDLGTPGIRALEATYNKQTKMAEITTKCETGKIDISINNAVTGSSILEKQAIPCNQTTPIGPLKVKAAYKVSAASNPEITPAIFTIS